jgi:hypothetical protein
MAFRTGFEVQARSPCRRGKSKKRGTITVEASDSKRTRRAPSEKESGAFFVGCSHMPPKLGFESILVLQESEGQEMEDNHR